MLIQQAACDSWLLRHFMKIANWRFGPHMTIADLFSALQGTCREATLPSEMRTKKYGLAKTVSEWHTDESSADRNSDLRKSSKESRCLMEIEWK